MTARDSANGTISPPAYRIIQAVNTLQAAGAERVAVDLAIRLHRNSWPVTVFTLDGGPLEAAVREAGVELVVCDSGASPLSAAQRLARLVRDGAPSVVHSHLIRMQLLARFASFLSRPAALVETQHDTYDRPTWAKVARRVTRSRVDAFVACSPSIARHLEADHGIARALIRTIENGVDTDAYAAGRSPWHSPAVIGSIGSMLAVKRYDVLIRSFADVVREFPEARLVLIGSGAERASLMELARCCGLERSVDFPGSSVDVPRSLTKLDIFVQPRVRSSVGVAMMEAMAAEKPVIFGTDEGFAGAPPNRVATMVPSASQQALTDCLLHLLRSPEVAMQQGREARAWVEQERSLEATASAHAQLYADLMQAR